MSKKNMLLAGAAASAALLVFGLAFTWIVGSNRFGTREKLVLAMSLLDDGRWDVAGRIARDLEAAEAVEPEEDSAWQYVQGVAKIKSVEQNLDSPRNRKTLLDATGHLERAGELGFPKGYHGKGRFFLGWCYFHTYQWDRASELLQDSERLWPERRSDAFDMMLSASLRKFPPDLGTAEVLLERWRAIPGMSTSEQAQFAVARASLAFLKQDTRACEDALNSVAPDLPEFHAAQLWRCRWRLDKAIELKSSSLPGSDQLLSEAADIARQLKLAPKTPADLRRQAAYISGRILRAQEKLSEALGTLSGARQSSPQSAEAIAATMEEAEVMLELNRYADCLANLRLLLSNIENLALYNELWMPVSDLRARLLAVGRALKDVGEFEQAIQLADFLALAFPKADSLRLQAEAMEQWANHLSELPRGNTREELGKQRELVLGKYLNAAQLYEQLAVLELRSVEYPDILWRAIANYQLARELGRANELLRDYLRYEDRTKSPRGFLALGRNYMDSGDWQKAIEPLQRCRIEHPTHPISFEARLLSAKAFSELDQLDEAVELLNENLSGKAGSLRPESEIWRDSLYQLGQTVFRQGDQLLLQLRLDPNAELAKKKADLEAGQANFLDAVEQLRGFVTRYPNDPRHCDAMYLIAKSHRLAAETPKKLAESQGTVVETARRKLMQQRRELLDRALVEFRELHQAINRQQDSLTTSEQSKALIRNCYFGEADTLFALGRWEEAITAYQNAASRFFNQPESLEALLQIAQCHRKLGQEAKAQKVLAQAEQVLARIPTELDEHFISLTRTNRDGWTNLIGTLRNWN